MPYAAVGMAPQFSIWGHVGPCGQGIGGNVFAQRRVDIAADVCLCQPGDGDPPVRLFHQLRFLSEVVGYRVVERGAVSLFAWCCRW